MKRHLFTWLMLLVTLSGKAQGKECFGLFTDRDLYTSGETMLLKAFAPSAVQGGILTVDLFNAKGEMIASVPLQISDNQADGFISLNDTLSSGSYLLRVLTQTSVTQTVKELYILNRFTGVTESGISFRPAAAISTPDSIQPLFTVSGAEKNYKRREKAHLTIHFPADWMALTEGPLCLYVAQAIPEYNAQTFVLNHKPKFSSNAGNEGIIISGIATDPATSTPFKNGVITLSVPDSLPRFNYYTTGENGRFYFQLKDYHGRISLVLNGNDPTNYRPMKISLDKQENLLSSLPPFKTGIFPPELRKVAAKNVEALNFSKIFKQQQISVLPAKISKTDAYPFYGVPERVIYPKLFVDLSNFEEISRELLQGIKFRDNNHHPTFQILNAQRNSFFTEQPLVLLNGVPVRNLNDIKDLGSREIDRIEISQYERYFGNLRFSGVVAIYAPKFDFEGLKESDDLIKLSLDAVQPLAVFNPAPNDQAKEPDLRQVLLWQPFLKPETTLGVDFQTSDIIGKFRVVISGKRRDGKLFFKEQSFEVN